MGMQLYETPAHRTAEAEFKKKIELKMQVECLKCPIKWEVDFIAVRLNKEHERYAVAMLELKCRDCLSCDYETAIIAKHKIDTAFGKLDWMNIPLYLFVRYLDTDKTVRIQRAENYKQTTMSAANHIEDPTDTEIVCHIPIKEMKEFK